MATDTVLPDIKTEIAGLNAREAQATQGLTALAGEDAQRAQAHAATLQPMEAALDQSLAAPAPTRRQTPGMPAQPAQSKLQLDPKEYEGLSFALIGMALVGGVASHGNWLGVSSTLNGALKGYMEGNQQKAQQEYEKYDRQFKAAVAQEKQADTEYQEALNSRKLTINEQLQRIENIARRNGQEDVLANAKAKNFQSVISQIEARRAQLLGTEQRHTDVTIKIDAQRDAAAAKAAKGGKDALTPEAAEWLAEYTKITGQAPSLWGGKAQIFNMLAAQGASPSEVAANKGEYAAINTALRQQESRAAGIENITQQIQQLEPEVIRLAKKTGLSESSLVNTPMNALRKRLGSADLAQLRTVLVAASREYIRATTAPQSQGQLHVASQEMGEDLLNSEMGIGQIMGSFRGINFDVNAGRVAATGIAKSLRDRVAAKYKMPDASAGGGAAPAAPAGGAMSLDDYLKANGAKKYCRK